MSGTGPRVPSKFIRFFRLVDACDGPGCPVCRCLVADARQYLGSLLYEQVNDPDTRRRLHASWGFCNWHAWMLREVSDPAFGSAIMYDDDPQFDRAYRRSQGLCVPHTLQAIQLGAGTTDAQPLVTRTLPKWAELRRDLQGFADKHDYRNRRPFTEAESTAYLRAIEVLTGARGLFANDLRAGARAAHGARGNDISPDRPLERGAEDADFERGKLELRIKELTEQLERLQAELQAARSAGGR